MLRKLPFFEWCVYVLIHLAHLADMGTCSRCGFFVVATVVALHSDFVILCAQTKQEQMGGAEDADAPEIEVGDCVLSVIGYLPRDIFESK